MERVDADGDDWWTRNRVEKRKLKFPFYERRYSSANNSNYTEEYKYSEIDLWQPHSWHQVFTWANCSYSASP